ncbi:Retrovirus-related Pol polyprotein from transposon 412 [Frankliniella fusca]|uniref:RNA-directed DNA polymerase n=1 Tax=Frankliniella fusca TaxID=407009 RepID=A0AAE1H3C7_9NEOP|nr:Retrovirus-related Pol polyprotein from transposon 412 [Frankliniella fusca]
MAFVGDVDQDVVLGHNFIYAHDLVPSPGDKKITIGRGSDGARLLNPVELPYQLMDTLSVRAAVIYQPVRICYQLRVEPGGLVTLENSSLRSPFSQPTSVLTAAVARPVPLRVACAAVTDADSCTPPKRVKLVDGVGGGQTCLASRDPLLFPVPPPAHCGGEVKETLQNLSAAAASVRAARWTAGRRGKSPRPGRYVWKGMPTSARAARAEEQYGPYSLADPRTSPPPPNLTSARQVEKTEDNPLSSKGLFTPVAGRPFPADPTAIGHTAGEGRSSGGFSRMCADKATKRAYHLKHCAPVSAAALGCTEAGGQWWREARVLLSEGPAPGVGRGTLSNEKRDHVSDRGSPCGPHNEGKPQATGNEPAAPAAPRREGLHSRGTEHVVHRALVMPPERTRMQDTVLVATQLCDPASPTVRLLNVGQKDTVIPKGAVVAELVLRHLDDDAHTRLADVLQGTLEKNSGVVEKAADQTGTAGSYPYTPHLVKLPPRSKLPESEPLPADLQAVVDRCEGIGAREKERVAALVREYSDCFSLNGEMGNCDWVYFEIDTQGHAPVREAPADLAHADALSRYPMRPCGRDCSKCNRVEELDQRADDSGAGASGEKDAGMCAVELHPAPGYDPSGWMRAQHADPEISPILAAVQAGVKPSLEQAVQMSDTTHALFLQYDSLVLNEDGLLCRRYEDSAGVAERDILQLVVPREKVDEVLTLYHDAPGSGSHQGRAKTLSLIAKRFYWPNYHRDVQDHCDRCVVCRERHGPGRRARAPLKVWQEGRLFGRWHADIAGPYPTSREGYKYALVCVEALTSFPEVIPMRTTADEVARAMVQLWSRYGACRVLRTDQGRAFEAELLQEVLKIFGIERLRCSPGRPQANGRAERAIRTIKDGLSKFIDMNQRDWPDFVPLVLLSYRAAAHTAHKYSPAELMYGRRLVLPADLCTAPPLPQNEKKLEGYPSQLREVLRCLHREARSNMLSASKKMKERYDRKARVTPFEAGDKVWFYNPVRKRGINPKLQRSWESGWKIAKVINDITMRIQREKRRPRVVHVDRLAKAAETRDGQAYTDWFELRPPRKSVIVSSGAGGGDKPPSGGQQKKQPNSKGNEVASFKCERCGALTQRPPKDNQTLCYGCFRKGRNQRRAEPASAACASAKATKAGENSRRRSSSVQQPLLTITMEVVNGQTRIAVHGPASASQSPGAGSSEAGARSSPSASPALKRARPEGTAASTSGAASNSRSGAASTSTSGAAAPASTSGAAASTNKSTGAVKKTSAGGAETAQAAPTRRHRPRCGRCNKKGHRAAECTKPAGQATAQPAPGAAAGAAPGAPVPPTEGAAAAAEVIQATDENDSTLMEINMELSEAEKNLFKD